MATASYEDFAVLGGGKGGGNWRLGVKRWMARSAATVVAGGAAKVVGTGKKKKEQQGPFAGVGI